MTTETTIILLGEENETNTTSIVSMDTLMEMCNVKSLKVIDNNLTDEDLKMISSIDTITSLSITCNQGLADIKTFTDQGWYFISGMKQLKCLIINSCFVDVRSFTSMRNLTNLESLYVICCYIDEECTKRISELESVKKLTIVTCEMKTMVSLVFTVC